jgi:antitoxin component of RelBE/YafQ-DinJ toxin-antitoxin module
MTRKWPVRSFRLDPKSWNNLVRRADRMGLTPSAALRYTLRRVRDPGDDMPDG